MPVQNYTGQQLVDGALLRLGGYSNAVSAADMLDYINEGKNELWAYLKGLRADYFGRFSQNTTPGADDYFPDLTPSAREYSLPPACREIKTIEILTSGYEHLVFEHADMSSSEFQLARRSATQSPAASSSSVYYWDVFGNQFIMAQYPPTVLSVRLGFIEAIPDIALGETVPAVLFPFLSKLKTYGAKRASLGTHNLAVFEAWRGQWKEDLQSVLAAASTRQIADARFAEGFLEDY